MVMAVASSVMIHQRTVWDIDADVVDKRKVLSGAAAASTAVKKARLATTQAAELENHFSGSPAAPPPPLRSPTRSLSSDKVFNSRVPDLVETRPWVDTLDMSSISPMTDRPPVILSVTLPPPLRSWHSFKGFPSFCSALPQLERSGLCSILDRMKASQEAASPEDRHFSGTPWEDDLEGLRADSAPVFEGFPDQDAAAGPSRRLSLPEDETPGKEELVVLGLTKANSAQDHLKTAASEACCCLTGTSCCLRCAKQLVNGDVYCSQLNCTARCHCCSSLQNKCDPVPLPFKTKMSELQALSDDMADGHVKLSVLSDRVKKFISEVDNYLHKQSPKKGTGAVLSGSATEMNNLLQTLSAQVGQLTEVLCSMAGVPVPPLPEEEFCGGEVDDE
ncbi:hypothetical protein AJ79_09435 [Helicocarpus griseus UAMH5409]|uniref:Uncharacterized protein n=1 Tax=Helicocarpus griseus UAMH5409 TaxID=1447875 RepID=A0A2B7WJW4_9EURO|nr:hypothetical protein AJ79_09435 [Helicocarpus griseus UAMH5409]